VVVAVLCGDAVADEFTVQDHSEDIPDSLHVPNQDTPIATNSTRDSHSSEKMSARLLQPSPEPES